jgi:anti-sigma factor RsiW
MNTRSEHVDFDVLNDYVDGLLDQRTTLAVSDHLSGCSECSGQHSKLTMMLTSVEELPKSVLPSDMWPELKQSLEQRKEIVLPVSATKPASGSPVNVAAQNPWRSRTFMAAAAVILVVVSSGVTALVLQNRYETRIAEITPESRAPGAPAAGAIGLSVSFRLAEGEYNRAIDQLVQAVNEQRNRLNPETIRTVDRSLAVVDSAIAEAKAALLADPNNGTLVDLLSASYQRKLDLLRRTSELSSRI